MDCIETKIVAPATAADIVTAYKDFNVSKPLADRIYTAAKHLNMQSAGQLANLICYESGFNPSAYNEATEAVGLIQFSKRATADFGKTTEDFKKMSAEVQMQYVEKWFELFYKSSVYFNTSNVYMTTFFPYCRYKGPSCNIYEWYLKHDGPRAAERFYHENGGIKTTADYMYRSARYCGRLSTGFECPAPKLLLPPPEEP